MVSINTEMECDDANVIQPSVRETEIDKNDSEDNFQNFIYDLFDKNGILSDLRAYLRGHIVNVLKSAQTGHPPLCQKKFTQRLELVSQALNMLIAEYLLKLDFTYTLSVFVSEIPLSNMVFDFAKALLNDPSPVPKLKFKDGDIWSVLNYLGVKCDSEHASNILEMYNNEEQTPLLHCILKCIPMYHKEAVGIDEENSSRDSLTSGENSSDNIEKKPKVHRNTSCHQTCKHYNFCKSCQNRISRLKEKCRERKKDFHKETRKSSVSLLNVENFMKNINVMEKRIINEMFEQLQSAYEAEVALVRQEEETRVRRTLASHALQLQQRREEMEESLKTKQAELESNAQHKKHFLWGVARALRDQHGHVARAMELLKDEQENLARKEMDLKTQLKQAEQTLRTKGEEMRVQISKELEILEGHLESLKRERNTLDKERSDLEHLKSLCDSKTRLIEACGQKEKEDLKGYEALKDEIAVLKKYIENIKDVPKSLIERSTITDVIEESNARTLNNTSCPERSSRNDVSDREVRPPNQLVNDLTKQKNVNFHQSNLGEVYRELSGERSRCSVSSEEAVGASGTNRVRERDTIQRLVAENESLKDYARRQSEHISALWCERPRTAPALLPAAIYCTVHRVNPSSSANTFGWRKGAGEELSLFPVEPPTLLPGDPIPFVGILRDRPVDNRRHLINQWRALKRRSSPLARINKSRPPIPIQRERGLRGAAVPAESIARERPSNVVRIADDLGTNRPSTTNLRQEGQSHDRMETSSAPWAKTREKSPKTVLKEAKERLRNKNSIKEKAPLQKRDKSPNSMLREAKLRLRKLEIEAQAVEKSYLDFRKKQAQLRGERKSLSILEGRLNTDVAKQLDVSKSKSFKKFSDNNEKATIPPKEADDTTKDFNKYLREYQTTFDIGETYFKNKNTAREKAKPIPMAYSEVNSKKDRKNVDYLGTPMMEFRKLYHAEKERNLSQLRSTTNLGPASIQNEDNLANNNKTDKHDNDNLQAVHDLKDATEINSKNNNEVYEDIINDMKKPNTSDFDNKEKKSDADVIQYNKLEALRKINKNKAVELEILKENINKIYNFKSPRSNIIPVEETVDHVPRANVSDITGVNDKLLDFDKSVLRVEVESSCEVNKVKMAESQQGDLVIVVRSSVTTKESDESDEAEEIPMVVEISPKDKTLPKDTITANSKRSESPEKAAQLTRNDVLNAIFHADNDKNVSSVDMQLDFSKENAKALSDSENPNGDYPDDFSADVDYYNSRSEYGNNSPISLPKSDNDNFWDN